MKALRQLFDRLDKLDVEIDHSWSTERNRVIEEIRRTIVEYRIDVADLNIPRKKPDIPSKRPRPHWRSDAHRAPAMRGTETLRALRRDGAAKTAPNRADTPAHDPAKPLDPAS